MRRVRTVENGVNFISQLVARFEKFLLRHNARILMKFLQIGRMLGQREEKKCAWLSEVDVLFTSET